MADIENVVASFPYLKNGDSFYIGQIKAFVGDGGIQKEVEIINRIVNADGVKNIGDYNSSLVSVANSNVE
jgi:hypothetical protein